MSKRSKKSNKRINKRIEARDKFLEEVDDWVMKYRHKDTGEVVEQKAEIYDNDKTLRQCRECVLDGDVIVQIYPSGPIIYSPSQYGAEATYMRIVNDRILYWQFGVIPTQLRIDPKGGF